MSHRFLLYGLVLLFLLQIITSLYYSHRIVSLNLSIQNQQQQLDTLSLENQKLTIDWANLNRLQILKDRAGFQNLRPIDKSLDLTHD